MEAHRVSLAETDAGGIVYHARYFDMAERSRNEAMRSVGVPVAELLRKSREGVLGTALVVHSVFAKFFAPAFLDDVLHLQTYIRKLNRARSSWRTAITRDGAPICTVDVDLVSLNVATGEPVLIAEDLVDALDAIPRETVVPTAARPSQAASGFRRRVSAPS